MTCCLGAGTSSGQTGRLRSWRVFSDRLVRAYEDDIAQGIALPVDFQSRLDKARDRRQLLDTIRNGYFGLADTSRGYRGSFKGMMVKPTYAKAAHLACVRDMLPQGKITLVGEQEASMVRVVPHIFRKMILDDLFEWFVLSFDKEASTPKTRSRIAKFADDFDRFARQEEAAATEEIPRDEMLRRYCSAGLTASVGRDRFGNAFPYPIANFQPAQFPSSGRSRRSSTSARLNRPWASRSSARNTERTCGGWVRSGDH